MIYPKQQQQAAANMTVALDNGHHRSYVAEHGDDAERDARVFDVVAQRLVAVEQRRRPNLKKEEVDSVQRNCVHRAHTPLAQEVK